MSHLVEVDNRSGMPLDESAYAALASRLLVRTGLPEGELGIAFVAPDEMTRLNREHMGRTGSTDVLSFPLDAAVSEPGNVAGSPLLLGDVVICPQTGLSLAGAAGTPPERELCLLLIHGILHLAGYDHETDNGEMDREQVLLHAELCGNGPESTQ